MVGTLIYNDICHQSGQNAVDSRGTARHVDTSNVVCNSCRQRQIGQSYCDIIASGGKTRHRQLTTLVSVSWGGGGGKLLLTNQSVKEKTRQKWSKYKEEVVVIK